jgi:hypothetical protein
MSGRHDKRSRARRAPRGGRASCPSREEVERALDGEASPARTDEVLGHLAACERCGRRAEELERLDVWLADALLEEDRDAEGRARRAGVSPGLEARLFAMGEGDATGRGGRAGRRRDSGRARAARRDGRTSGRQRSTSGRHTVSARLRAQQRRRSGFPARLAAAAAVLALIGGVVLVVRSRSVGTGWARLRMSQRSRRRASAER